MFIEMEIADTAVKTRPRISSVALRTPCAVYFNADISTNDWSLEWSRSLCSLRRSLIIMVTFLIAKLLYI